MSTPARPLVELLTELESAVRAGDRSRAVELERAILRRIATETADRDELERRVRALMSELDQHIATAEPTTRTSLYSERSAAEPADDGVVYPVWFGTNRKPPPAGDSFTGQRHHRVTHGRVDVYVPEAHRFGETGNSFWKRLLRVDLRDDRLRLQRVEPKGRDAFFAEIQEAVQTARAGLPARVQRELRGGGDSRGANRL